MNNNNNRSWLGTVVAVVIAFYAAYRIIEAVVSAVEMLLDGLVIIALVTAGIFALFWVYRFVTDQQYGTRKHIRSIEKLERERRELKARLPKHLRSQADAYIKSKQADFFDFKPQSRLEVFLEKVAQFFSRKPQE